jgi:hypothetical protein
MLLEDQTYSFGNPALLLGHTAFANKDCKNLSSLWSRLFQLWKISFVIFAEIGLLFAEAACSLKFVCLSLKTALFSAGIEKTVCEATSFFAEVDMKGDERPSRCSSIFC